MDVLVRVIVVPPSPDVTEDVKHDPALAVWVHDLVVALVLPVIQLEVYGVHLVSGRLLHVDSQFGSLEYLVLRHLADAEVESTF